MLFIISDGHKTKCLDVVGILGCLKRDVEGAKSTHF